MRQALYTNGQFLDLWCRADDIVQRRIEARVVTQAPLTRMEKIGADVIENTAVSKPVSILEARRTLVDLMTTFAFAAAGVQSFHQFVL